MVRSLILGFIGNWNRSAYLLSTSSSHWFVMMGSDATAGRATDKGCLLNDSVKTPLVGITGCVGDDLPALDEFVVNSTLATLASNERNLSSSSKARLY